MRSKKLLVVAYKALRRGEEEAAKEIFIEAMEDETAPELMEEINEIKDIDDIDDNDDDNDNDDDELDIDADNDDDNDDNDDDDVLDIDADNDDDELDIKIKKEAPAAKYTSTQVAQVRSIANQLASKGHRKLAKKLLQKVKVGRKIR